MKELKLKQTFGGEPVALHAVVTTEHGTHVSIYVDGSVHIRWASGGATDITPNGATGEEALANILPGLEEMIPTVHLAPQSFTSLDAIDLWFKSIGLETTRHAVQ